jgi:hypothetical protein
VNGYRTYWEMNGHRDFRRGKHYDECLCIKKSVSVSQPGGARSECFHKLDWGLCHDLASPHGGHKLQ